MDQVEIVALVDEMVSVDSAIKRLEARKEELKQKVVSLGEGIHTGEIGKVAVAVQTSNRMSQDIVKTLLTEEQLKTCYVTSTSIVCRVTEFGKEKAPK